MGATYIVKDGKEWCCLSIFYARENWFDLLSELDDFYCNNRNLFDYCLIGFSEERGEHMRVTFSPNAENSDELLEKIENHFTLFLNKEPSAFSKQFSFGEGFWCYYPNNSLVWNRYNMRYYNKDLLFDKQLEECLLAFENQKLTDYESNLYEEAFDLLEQIQQKVVISLNGSTFAKWGCLVEYLAKKSFVEVNLDELLEEVDTLLMTLWNEMAETIDIGISEFFLWIGDYFLFRICGEQPQMNSQFSKMLEQMLRYIEHFLLQLLHTKIYVEPIFLFPISFWKDLEWWLLCICQLDICRLAETTLANLYALPNSNILLYSNSLMDDLRWQLRNGYFPK
ncbi:MAG: hypothetical protein MSH64_02610 [Bacteroides uniformis]|nr:hypothetical protein [Bacteroides uniformis]